MNEVYNKYLLNDTDQLKSKSGYFFKLHDYAWHLSKNNIVHVGLTTKTMDERLVEPYLKVLSYYAINYSSAHVNNINDRFLNYLRHSKIKLITVNGLINYRSSLSAENEWYLGVIRGLLRKWHDLGYPGVTNDVIELLDGWSLKGNLKGDVIKRLDPLKGPLSDGELLSFNERAVQAFEKGKVTLTEMAMGLVLSNTGRRPIQISHLRLKDVLKAKNKRGENAYFLNVPRAKQRETNFRKEFKQFAITEDLWVILNAQARHVIRQIKVFNGFDLPDNYQMELPMFPDMSEIKKIETEQELVKVLQIDKLHIASKKISSVCKRIVKVANIYSERTGELLNISSNRFRYTTGTRAAREGFGEMVIAELLDHSDNQNAGVYIENIPEHVENLDHAIGHQLALYAQAFAGILVESEQMATRGNDSSSRVRIGGEGVGTCGSYGFCGANVPIPCYTCMHFQPWLYGPHETVYEDLIAERDRLLKVTGDVQIAAINDRSIFAVAEVIQKCSAIKEDIANG